MLLVQLVQLEYIILIHTKKKQFHYEEDEDIFQICCIHKLKTKDEMVFGGDGQNMLWFLNTKTFKKEKLVECCDCSSFNGIIELPNHHIMLMGHFHQQLI